MNNFDLTKYLAEGKLYENVLAQKLRDEATQPDSKVGAAIFNKYAKKVEKADKEDYVKLLKAMENELISKHPDTFSGEDDIPGSFL
jgi:translation initiation factor 2B subunit (eIF-2B alpha/beta/delta family)